ncbi:FeoB-associated Cys-rich membrane protein [Defluviitalea saccharophila]|uniref:FeoB-associated Cys-rich membrane protein n=1 Tax=Defluviitalea saccharophila TaxID=879970 RepID=A0ABZ2Y4K8_9FIRM
MATWIIGSIVLAGFAWVGYRTFKQLTSDEGCSGGCSGCSHSHGCGKE